MSCNLRILLVDNHTLIRKGLRALIADWEGFEVIGEARDGEEGLELALKLFPDIILMDIHIPRLDGLEVTRRLKDLLPEAKVVILTLDDSPVSLMAALEAGAKGYLLKTAEPQQLYYLLQEVAGGKTALTPALIEKMLPRLTKTPTLNSLSAREKEVLELVAQGFTNREIAQKLYISENTVKNHLRSILEKLQSKNRLQAVQYALQQGWIKAPK